MILSKHYVVIGIYLVNLYNLYLVLPMTFFFCHRMREVSDKVNKFGFGTHRVFDQLKIPVKEVVIGPNHIGILLEDGKAFRVVYSINSDRLDLSKNDASKR